jgi:nucleoside 2-deoxyribosyltransferase
MKKIYVGCSLTHATQEYRDGIEEFKKKLGEKYEVLKFLGLGVGTGREQFDWDTNCVKSSDLVVADVSYPSTGLGIELGVAFENKIPVLLLASNNAKIASMLQGHPTAVREMVRYERIEDMVGLVDEEMSKL